MKNTVRDVVIHFIIGAICFVVGLPNFFFRVDLGLLFDAKQKASMTSQQLMQKAFVVGSHFSVVGFILVFVAAVFIILAFSGVGVAASEKKN